MTVASGSAAYCAMTITRPRRADGLFGHYAQARQHRPALALGKVLEAVGAGAGREYDPHVVEVALAIPPERWAALLGVGGTTGCNSQPVVV